MSPGGAALALLRNLWGGLRLAAFARVEPGAFHVSAAQIVALAALGIALLGIDDYLRAAPQHYFSVYGVTSLGTSLLLLLLSVLAIAALGRQPGRASTLLLLIVAAQPLFILAGIALQHGVDHVYRHLERDVALWLAWGAWLALVAWILAFVARATRMVLAPRLGRVLVLVAVYACFNVLPDFVIGTEPLFYGYEETAEEDDDREPVDVERVYYAQAALVAEAVQALEPDRPGTVDLYFVGFAPYAEQDVFMKEVEFVRALFDTRFDTTGRSLNLINNPATVEHVALANATNLRAALAGIAERMDLDEDVLFLFLTSHGSRDGVLAASFWPLEPNDLDAPGLAAMLDEAGIKWRIVVVSACYSGSFIDALANERTLILTAASEDRDSFGCSQDRDFTYFGEHYFRDGLAQGTSFVQAFEQARDSIEAREAREELTPSQPQMRMGAGMPAKLEALQARLGR